MKLATYLAILYDMYVCVGTNGCWLVIIHFVQALVCQFVAPYNPMSLHLYKSACGISFVSEKTLTKAGRQFSQLFSE